MTVASQALLTSDASQASHFQTCKMTGISETITSHPRPRFVYPRHLVSLTVSRELRGRPWFRETLIRFLELLSLGENWNGYGERAIRDTAVKRALNVLEVIGTDGPTPSVVPMSDGGLQLEWMGNEFEIEVEIPPEGLASVLIIGPNNEESECSVGPRSEVWASLRELITQMGRESS